MKKAYIQYNEDGWEFEAAFDEDFKLLGAWSCNDATWRNEYFSGFMEKLGIEVIGGLPLSSAKIKSMMKKASKDTFGI